MSGANERSRFDLGQMPGNDQVDRGEHLADDPRTAIHDDGRLRRSGASGRALTQNPAYRPTHRHHSPDQSSWSAAVVVHWTSLATNGEVMDLRRAEYPGSNLISSPGLI